MLHSIQKRFKQHAGTWIGMLLAFMMGLYFFSVINKLPVFTDMQIHNTIIQEIVNGKFIMPPHFLYFFLVMSASFFSSNMDAIIGGVTLVLSIALMLKFLATRQVLARCLQPEIDRFPDEKKKLTVSIVLLLSFLLLFLTNMPNKPFWDLLPLSWHNSTTIFLMPFAIWLFWSSYRFLETKESKFLWQAALMGLLNIVIKPNFVLVLIAVFPLFVFYRYKFSASTFKVVAVVLLFILALGAQYYYTYHFLSAKGLSKGYNHVEIVFSPFDAWHRISANLLFSFSSWALYPILFLVFHFRAAMKSMFYNYTLSLFVTAFLIFIVFTEREVGGKNIAAVNFIWQVIICHYILCIVSAIEHFKIILKQGKVSITDYLLAGVLLMYILSGLSYVLRTVVLHD